MSKNTTPHEDEEQIAFIDMFRILYPGVFIYSTPNEGKRSYWLAEKMVSMGLTSGIPDLFIPRWWLYIEMKRQKGGVLRPDQEIVIAQLNDDGYDVILAKGCNEALADIETMMAEHWHVTKEKAIALPRRKW